MCYVTVKFIFIFLFFQEDTNIEKEGKYIFGINFQTEC